jgi:hypothetical protein
MKPGHIKMARPCEVGHNCFSQPKLSLVVVIFASHHIANSTSSR